MHELTKQTELASRTMLGASFRWKTNERHGGQRLLPSEMDTHHVFFTLCMIWNHSMPEEARMHNYKGYVFSSFYTEEYMIQAIHALSRELSTRKDMKPEWKRMLEGMLQWLGRYQVQGQYLLKES